MIYFIKRAVLDICSNSFLTIITIGTISLSILIVSAFLLVFENVSSVIDSWNDEIKIMAYLKPEISADVRDGLQKKIQAMPLTDKVRFVSNQDALDRLKNDMGPRQSLLDGLKVNPLPDGFEISIRHTSDQWKKIEPYAGELMLLTGIEEVQYGQEWMGRFSRFYTIFKMTGYTMAGFFCFIALFITANTVRLALYARREEVEIMRLVGATDRFIVAPFYIEGFLQGIFGGTIGLLLLALFFKTIASSLEESIPSYALLGIQFISLHTIIGVMIFSSFLGWLGCYLSLKHFLNS